MPQCMETKAAKAASGNAKATNDQEMNNWSAYKKAQVRCKQHPVEDIHNLPGLVDICCYNDDDDRISRIPPPPPTNHCQQQNDCQYYQGPMFGLKDYPGFLMFPQAISKELQLQLAYAAVTEYCESPHATNIDLVPPKPSEVENGVHETLWNLWKSDNRFLPATNINSSNTKAIKKYYKTFKKLSWATMGYQYDWTARTYHEGAKSPMPAMLGDLATFFARTSLALSLANNKDTNNKDTATTTTTTSTKFTPSASIVNYYTTKSVMGGHRDDLEYALDKPVVSISMGLAAIFLLGGNTKEDTPVLPILVRPGDVIILGGSSRLNYHGMAKMIPYPQTLSLLPRLEQTLPITCNKDSSHSPPAVIEMEENDPEALESFLQSHRININVRQVHKDGNH